METDLAAYDVGLGSALTFLLEASDQPVRFELVITDKDDNQDQDLVLPSASRAAR